MAFRKIWILCYIAVIAVIIGYFVPYASIWESNVHLWMFGLITSPSSTYFLPLVYDVLTMFLLGIIIVVLAVVSLFTCFVIRRREEKRVMCILKGVGGLIIAILAFLVPTIMDPITLNYLRVSIGFYLILIGSILQVVFGIFCTAIK